VSKWLMDYTTDHKDLESMSLESRRLHEAKARIAEATENCIARIGTNGPSM